MKKKASPRTGKTTKEMGRGPVRLQKLLAAHGHGSRRACEAFIVEGRVEVDGVVVDQLGTKVDPDQQKVTLDGERIVLPQLQYFMLNKPPGVLSTASDPTGRIRVIDLIDSKSRVYNVGRLDKSSEGLILVTNDGDLAHKLTHPRYGVEKKYHVMVAGTPDREKLASLRKGVYLAEAFVQVANVTVKKRMRDRTLLEIVLDEGRNREIRRLLAKIGHKVTQLKRVAIGPLPLGELPSGSHRKLVAAEIKLLKRAVSGQSTSTSSRASNSGKRQAKTAALKKGAGTDRPTSPRFGGSAKKKTTRKKSVKKKTGRRAAASNAANKKRASKKSSPNKQRSRRPR